MVRESDRCRSHAGGTQDHPRAAERSPSFCAPEKGVRRRLRRSLGRRSLATLVGDSKPVFTVTVRPRC